MKLHWAFFVCLSIATFLSRTLAIRLKNNTPSQLLFFQPSQPLQCPTGCCPCSTDPVCPVGCVPYAQCPNNPSPPVPTYEFPVAPWDKCVDDFKQERVGKFNRVDSAKVISTLGRPNQCLHYLWKRVLIAEKCSTRLLRGNIQISGLHLHDICAVQTNTVNVFAEVTTECDGNTCVVSIPCVTPRILITHNYTFKPTVETVVQGRFVLEVKSEPVTLKVTLVRDNQGVCSMSHIDETVLTPYTVVPHYDHLNPYVPQIDKILVGYTKSTTIYERLKKSVEMFAFQVIAEAIRQESRIFLPDKDLSGFCTGIKEKDDVCPSVIPPTSPTVRPVGPTDTPTVSPDFNPMDNTTKHPATLKICTDELSRERNSPFNLVDTKKILSINKVRMKDRCFTNKQKRVLIQSLNLTNSFSSTEHIQDLQLKDGCLVQSTTVNRHFSLTFYCTTGSFKCKVTFPCVIPRVLLTYYYVLAGIQPTLGMVTVDVHDGPIDLVLNFVRDNNDKCTVLNELDDTLLAKYRVVMNFKGGNNKGQYQSRVKTLMEDLVQKGWPYYSYKEEVKRFLIEIFIEFYHRKHNLFDLDGKQLRLKQYCKSLTIQPSIPTEKPTMEPPIPTPSIDPVSLRPTCRDEYLYNRTQEFNIIDPTLVLKYIDMPNECVNPSWKRVLIKDRQLSPYPLHHSQYKNIQKVLSDGCLVQSITLPYRAQLTTECISNSNTCVVTIPCIVPRMVIGYKRKHDLLKPPILMEIYDDPITVQVTIEKSNPSYTRVCKISEVNNEHLLSTYKVFTITGSNNSQKHREITRKIWLYPMYKNEVRAFAVRVILEAFYQTSNVFSHINDLHQICDDIVEEPTSTIEPESITITPTIEALFTTVDFEIDKATSTVEPESLTIAPTTEPTFTFDVSDIDEPTTTIERESQTISHTTESIFTTFGPDSIQTTSPTCTDDYHQFRENSPFNLVDTSKIISINKVKGSCLNLNKKRVLIQSLNLTNSFSSTEHIQDLQLKDGCLVQSNTVNRDLRLSLDCTTGSFKCKVTFPCVIPRVLLTYYYVLAGIQPTLGMVTVDVHDGPIDLVLNFVRDNNDKCTVLNELDDTLLAKYRVVMNFKGGNNKGQYQSRVKTLMEDLVQKGWPYYSYKEEVKRFLIEIFIEIYHGKLSLFNLDGKQLRLKQYCKSLTIQPSIPTEKPTMEPPIPTPSIDPVSLPPTCRDEYLYNRTQEFNIIDPTLVLKYIDMPNECVNPSWKRVLIKDRQLSPYSLHHSQYKNVQKVLSDGCLVQSITLPYRAQLTTECISNSNICVVTIPCIVPRMVIGYKRKHDLLKPPILMEIYDDPITVQVTIEKSNPSYTRVCKISEVNNEHLLSTYKVFTITGSNNSQKQREITKKIWLYPMYKNEVRAFAVRVILEAFYQTSNVFSHINDLHQICDEIVEEPTSTIQPGSITIAPTIDALFTTVDFEIDKATSTVEPESLTIAPTTEPTFTFDVSDIDEPTTTIERESQTISHTTESIFTIFGPDSIQTTSPTCTDDYRQFRENSPFNLVDTSKIISINKVKGSCLNLNKKRVLIQSLNLTNSFSSTEHIQDVQLKDGCLVQSTTVNRDLRLSLDCTTGSFKCKVTFPCVIPRVLLTYYYVLAGIQPTLGMVTVDVHDGPIDLVLNFVRDNNDKCTVLNELDDTLLAKYRVVMNFKGGNNKGQYQSRVKTLMEDLVQKGWPYYAYKEEVKRFLIEIFIEFYYGKLNLFYLDGQQLRLKQYCKSLTIQPSIPTEKPTMEPPIPTPSIDPVSLPPTCRDEYLYNRTQEFNIIDPTLVLKYIDMPNECVNPSWKRVLIKDRQLSPYSLHHSQYKNVQKVLSDGCLVQSITLPHRAQLTTECISNSNICVVTIPCIVPRMVIGYKRKHDLLKPPILMEIYDDPITVQVTIEKSNPSYTRVCKISEVNNEHLLSTYKVFTITGSNNSQKQREITRKIWLYPMYKNEVRAFAVRVILEAFYQTSNVFSHINDLHQICDEIVEEPTSTIQPESITIAPTIEALFTTVDFEIDKATSTVEPESLTIAPTTEPTFTFDVSDIDEPTTTIERESQTISHTTESIFTIFGPDSIQTTSPTCTDDYHQFRENSPFNLVDTSKIISINKVKGSCLNLNKKRVLIQSLNLTNSFSSTEHIQDLQLKDGCLVQSTTVNRDLRLSLDCTTGSFKCKVTFPCIFPRVLLTYYYVLAGIQPTLGMVTVDVHDGPIDMVLNFVRDNNDKCTVLNELDDTLLAKYRVVMNFKGGNNKGQYQSRVKTLMEDLVQKGWPYYSYKEEVKRFLIEIFIEFYQRKHNLFDLDGHQLRLKQYCKSLTIQPSIPTEKPTMEPPIPTPSINPVSLPPTCKDEYLYNRTQEFNIIDPTLVLKYINMPNECVNPSWKRVLIKDRQLSPYPLHHSQYKNVQKVLSDGCLVQSITLPYRAQLTTECISNSNICVVTIPCIVPRMVIGYKRKHDLTNTINLMEIYDDPITLQVTIEKSNTRVCKISEVNNEQLLSTYKVFINTGTKVGNDYQERHELAKKKWLYPMYKNEIRAFTVRVILEAFYQTSNVFSHINILHQICDEIVERRPTDEITTTAETIVLSTTQPSTPSTELPLIPAPTLEPLYEDHCQDDYSTSRRKAFNIINSRRVLDIISKPFPCIGSDKQRVIPGKKFYSPQMKEKFNITDKLHLNGGCLIQSVTFPYQTQLVEDCNIRRGACIVTVPCVVPRIVIGYSFLYETSDGKKLPGKVVVAVHDDPIDIPVLVKTETGRASSIVDEILVLKQFKVTVAPDQRDPFVSQEVKAVMVDYIQRTGWPFNLYKEEVKHVMMAVIDEAMKQTSNVVGSLPQLQVECEKSDSQSVSRSISTGDGLFSKDEDQEELKCIDDFSLDRKNKFNRIDSFKLAKFLNKRGKCLRRKRKRILLGDSRLTPDLDKTLEIELDSGKFSDVCLVQSITLPNKAKLPVACNDRLGICEVTLPCVLPILNLGFSIKSREGIKTFFIDVFNNPTDLTVTLSSHLDGTCEITEWFENSIVSNLNVTLTEEDVDESRVEGLDSVVQKLAKSSWFSSVLKTELQHFVFEVIQETLQQRWKVFRNIPKLKKICNSLVWEDSKVKNYVGKVWEKSLVDVPIRIEVKFSDDIAARRLGRVYNAEESKNSTVADQGKLENIEFPQNEEVE